MDSAGRRPALALDLVAGERANDRTHGRQQQRRDLESPASLPFVALALRVEQIGSLRTGVERERLVSSRPAKLFLDTVRSMVLI